MTDNFSLAEFACKHCGAVKIDPVLVEKLQQLREKTGRAIAITSGYRCPEHNYAVGGVANSEHVKGKAADIVVPGLTPTQVGAIAEHVGFGGIGIYEGQGFVHVDTRANRARWSG